MVQEGDEVSPGDVLAKIPRETTKTKDITGGLPRVVELFEARKPHEPAVITEIDGVVRYADVVKGQRKILVVPDKGETKEYLLPRGVHVSVQEGERVKAGEPLMDGPRNPHDILAVLGEKELEKYLVDEIQEVYRLQGVNINDKHIEVIARQMMRWVKVEEVGDTEFLLDEQVDKFKFREENDRAKAKGGKPATGRALLLGITKASLATDSFISAASFQETTRVLTEASIRGAVDHLRGLKENVIMGRLIPAGTGLEFYRNFKLLTEAEPPAAGSHHAGGSRHSRRCRRGGGSGPGGRGRSENAVERSQGASAGQQAGTRLMPSGIGCLQGRWHRDAPPDEVPHGLRSQPCKCNFPGLILTCCPQHPTKRFIRRPVESIQALA